jgi:YhcH/YjgK/YiaL family protein
MILDQIQYAELYAGLHPRIATGLRFLMNFNLGTFVPGRKELEDKALFVLFQEYESKPLEASKWESHRRYADIQFICEGEERIGYAPCASLRETTAYNAKEDYSFLEGEGQHIHLRKGWFAIFFPQDAHRPCVAVDQPAPVRKIVVKVEL